MQLDIDKFHRLSEQARKEHGHLTDLGERRDNTRAEYQRQYISLERQIRQSEIAVILPKFQESKGDPRKLEKLLTADELEYRLVKGLLKQMEDVGRLYAEYGRLRSEYEAQAERWGGAAACLPALREFVKGYGHKLPETVLDVGG